MVAVLVKAGRELLIAAIVTLLMAVFVFGWQWLAPEIDIHLHDTYFIIYSPHFLIALFLGTGFILFLLKEFRNKFTRGLPNTIILAIGLALVFFLTILTRFFPVEDRTYYPPLSSFAGENPELTKLDDSNTFVYIIIGLQVLTILALLHVAFHWGRSKSKPA
jgi:hypothetical protein